MVCLPAEVRSSLSEELPETCHGCAAHHGHPCALRAIDKVLSPPHTGSRQVVPMGPASALLISDVQPTPPQPHHGKESDVAGEYDPDCLSEESGVHREAGDGER